eukprot:symbB.v1.2.029558.t1/scaffold3245.1/size65031/4
MNNRRRITEEFPESIDNPHLGYHVPLDEGMEDNTLFSDLLDEAEDFPEEDDGDEPDKEQQEEDAEMVESSGEEKMDDKESKEEEKTEDDPMGEEKEEGPEAKKRRVAKLVESIPNAASAEDEIKEVWIARNCSAEIDQIMRVHDRKCPCCLTETPSFIALCLFCHAEFWSAGKYVRIVPEGEEQKNKRDRERITKAAKEAYRKAQEENEQMPPEDKIRIQEDEKEVEENAEEFGKESEESKASTDKPEERSFADADQQNDHQAGNEEHEDLSMFERDLRSPEEGAMCIDRNLQEAKYMIIYLVDI